MEHTDNRERTPPFDAVFGVEPHGFIQGSNIAHTIGTGFVPIRKKGKLPAATVEVHEELEVHADAVVPGSTVLLVGDVYKTLEKALLAKGVTVQRQLW